MSKSLEHEYEELARSIGSPSPEPNRAAVRVVGGLALAGALVAILAYWWFFSMRDRTAPGGGLGLLYPFMCVVALSVVVGIVVLVWLVLLSRATNQSRREATRAEKLAKIVTNDPKFRSFYEEWVKRARGGRGP